MPSITFPLKTRDDRKTVQKLNVKSNKGWCQLLIGELSAKKYKMLQTFGLKVPYCG